MSGITDIDTLLKSMRPKLHDGQYVFCTADQDKELKLNEVLCTFREEEGLTLVLNREIADRYKLEYSYIASWITLTVHSSLEAVGLTAAFASALANAEISCNVIAAYYHDHIFVDHKDAKKAIQVLEELSA